MERIARVGWAGVVIIALFHQLAARQPVRHLVKQRTEDSVRVLSSVLERQRQDDAEKLHQIKREIDRLQNALTISQEAGNQEGLLVDVSAQIDALVQEYNRVLREVEVLEKGQDVIAAIPAGDTQENKMLLKNVIGQTARFLELQEQADAALKEDNVARMQEIQDHMSDWYGLILQRKAVFLKIGELGQKFTSAYDRFVTFIRDSFNRTLEEFGKKASSLPVSVTAQRSWTQKLAYKWRRFWRRAAVGFSKVDHHDLKLYDFEKRQPVDGTKLLSTTEMVPS